MKKNINQIFIGNLIKKGYKNKSEKAYFGMLSELKKQNKNVVPTRELVKNVDTIRPYVRLLRKKVGGTYYEIPLYISVEQQKKLGVKWFIAESNKKSKGLVDKLKDVSLDISTGTGDLIKKKQQLHKKAIDNRVYLKLIN